MNKHGHNEGYPAEFSCREAVPEQAAVGQREAGPGAAEESAVRCRLCPHECLVKDGKSGICRSRVNKGGRLYSTAYGRVCAINTDPVEKKPLLHFYPGAQCFSIAAAGCNLSCLNCQNWSISQAAPQQVPYRTLPPEDVPRAARQAGCTIVAYTYTEPLTWLEYTRDCASACRQAGMQNILVTAGYVNREPLSGLLPYIDAANVDLKSFSDDIYRRVSHGSLAPVLDTLLQMWEAGVWVEMTNLLIPGLNDSPVMLYDMCKWLVDNGFADSPLFFSRFFPQYRMQDRPPTPVKTLLDARDIAMQAGLHYIYLGNVGLPDAENTYCPVCGRLLVERHGYEVESPSFKGVCPSCGAAVPGVWA